MDFRCILGSRNITTNKGMKAVVNEYSTKAGNSITEIITELGNHEKGIREIHKDFAGNTNKVIDNVFGRLETYYPAKVGVIQVAEDGTRTAFPHISMEQLTNI